MRYRDFGEECLVDQSPLAPILATVYTQFGIPLYGRFKPPYSPPEWDLGSLHSL